MARTPDDSEASRWRGPVGAGVPIAKRWVLPEAIPQDVDRALSDFPPIQRRILARRGIHSAAEAAAFFEGDKTAEADPFRLTGTQAAVARLLVAVEQQHPIVVYGDYDADGVTATVLLVEALESIGGRVTAYIPNRFDEGYGLHSEALTQLAQDGARLVVTVDCGIRSEVEAEHARRLGVDLIITDHHHPGPRLPNALAILNPKRPGDGYPFKELTGVGVAYKLAQAVARQVGRPDPVQSLDLVAIGTVADVGPLEGENRLLVSQGLARLNRFDRRETPLRPGLRALMEAAGLRGGQVTASSIAYALAPRLNAAGRMDTADKAYRLLRSLDTSQASLLADGLEEANRQRQRLTRDTVARARSIGVGDGPAPTLIVAIHPEFNAGIVGLAAARLMEEFYRPVVIASQESVTTRGSARSIPEFHITEALDACAEMLIRHGGHSSAAGFTVTNENLGRLTARLSALAELALGGRELQPRLEIDATVHLSDLEVPLREFIDRLEPCGAGNPLPVLASRRLRVVSSRAVGRDAAHLKLTLEGHGRVFDAIAFRQGVLARRMPQEVDVAFHLTRDDYMGVEALQMNIIDIRPAGGAE